MDWFSKKLGDNTYSKSFTHTMEEWLRFRQNPWYNTAVISRIEEIRQKCDFRALLFTEFVEGSCIGGSVHGVLFIGETSTKQIIVILSEEKSALQECIWDESESQTIGLSGKLKTVIEDILESENTFSGSNLLNSKAELIPGDKWDVRVTYVMRNDQSKRVLSIFQNISKIKSDREKDSLKILDEILWFKKYSDAKELIDFRLFIKCK